MYYYVVLLLLGYTWISKCSWRSASSYTNSSIIIIISR